MTNINITSEQGVDIPQRLVSESLVASLHDIKKTYYMGSLSVEVLHGISLKFYSGDWHNY